ncbi:MAG: 6,7-dimethyl-8-ribityllumazine synthase, partial [Pseudomonadota bacterium]
MSNYRLIEGAAQLAVSPERRSSTAARDLSVAIIAARFNAPIVDPMLAAALDAWQRHGGDPARVTIVRVPGAFELPLAASKFAETRRYDCLVALGCVIRGDTPHFEYIAGAAASGISQAAYDSGVP